MTDYVALLRGINVGGRNVIKMADLKACFDKHGFRNVVTYIQSGNVLFGAAQVRRRELNRHVEEILTATFDYRAVVVIRSRRQLLDVVAKAPKHFGTQPDKYRYDVIFLKEPLTAPTAQRGLSTRPGVDEAHAGVGVVYLSRLISRASESRLNRLATQPIYQRMTIRNWNTTTRLVCLMEDRV